MFIAVNNIAGKGNRKPQPNHLLLYLYNAHLPVATVLRNCKLTIIIFR